MPQVFKPTVRTTERNLKNEDRIRFLEERKATLAAFGIHEVGLTENQIRTIVAALGCYESGAGGCTKALQNKLGQLVGYAPIPKRDFQIELFSNGKRVLNISKFPAYSEEDIEAHELDTIIAELDCEGEVEYAITELKSEELEENTSCPF